LNAPWNLGYGRLAWSPDSVHVLIGGSYLPVDDSSDAGRAGQAVAVVDTRDGSYEKLPLTVPQATEIVLSWRSPSTIEIEVQRKDGQLERYDFTHTTTWVRTSDTNKSARSPRWLYYLRQGLNVPPKIYGHDSKTGRDELLLDVLPHFAEQFVLGRVKYLAGALPTGETWECHLYYPQHYRPDRRFPLVIQAEYGSWANDVFSLFGPTDGATGPPLFSSYAAQSLAGIDIAVADITVHRGEAGDSTPGAEGERNVKAFEALISRLTSEGLVDPLKVALSGFSRNGYYIDYALTHSSYRFAAALAVDNWDPSYISTGLYNWDAASSAANGADPFGAGLQTWLETAPGFNAEKIRAPFLMVMLTGGTGGFSSYWELFSRLKYLHRPVELDVTPDLEHGIHNTQNPQQLLAVQKWSIDWFDFWLNGHEDTSQKKADQYRRWEVLCDQQREQNQSGPTFCVSSATDKVREIPRSEASASPH
jgi:dipeptidyl aminopeptidase/acylaminoacyl peptidase